MDKNERLVLQAFCEAKPPKSFADVDMGMFVADLMGFAQRLLHYGCLELRENEKGIIFSLSDDEERMLGTFIGDSYENTLYYYIVKSCLVIFEKYRK